MPTETQDQRQHWMSVFAKTHVSALSAIWQELALSPAEEWLRPPETGAVMVRGRMGGSGAPFNMGEMTVTRATVCMSDGTLGFGYVAGRAHRKAELAALLDAAFQQDSSLAEQVLPPLVKALHDTRTEKGRKAASTKVDFFTLVRGDNIT